MLFSCVEGDINIKTEEIVFLETLGHKSIIHGVACEYNIYMSMNDLDVKLKSYGFLRIHRSYMVNMDHIRKVSNYMMTLSDGTVLKVPKGRFKQVKQAYTEYLGNVR